MSPRKIDPLVFYSIKDPAFLELLEKLELVDEAHDPDFDAITDGGEVLTDEYGVQWWHTSGFFCSYTNSKTGEPCQPEEAWWPDDQLAGAAMSLFRVPGKLRSKLLWEDE